MPLNDLSRAVALKALAADVGARLRLGERPAAVRADLLNEGFPSELIDHAFAACERARPVGRRRTVLAAVVAGGLMIGLPLLGTLGGTWAAITLVVPAHESERHEDVGETKARVCGLEPGVAFVVFVPLGALTGFAAGLGLAFPAVKALSAWSIDETITDDEGYD
jgi:hypothetical protein